MTSKSKHTQSGAVELAAQEQVVVDQFAEVIRRHRACGLVALARLASIAFELSIGPKPSREDNLVLALARGLEVRQHLAKAEGGSLSSKEVARLLGISKTAVLQRLEAGRLVAWRQGGRQTARFPRWQFGQHGQVLAGLEAVLKILNRNQPVDAWGRILFFLQTEGSLGNKRPLDLLREGRVNDVRMAAEAYVG